MSKNNDSGQTPQNTEIEELKKQLEEANARAEKAETRATDAEKGRADAEAQLRKIAKAEGETTAAKADTVRIKLPIEKNGPNEDQQVFINGRQYIIKRGVEVDVPRGVAEILSNREKMQAVVTAFDKENAKG